jgi:hypothetical protein
VLFAIERVLRVLGGLRPFHAQQEIVLAAQHWQKWQKWPGIRLLACLIVAPRQGYDEPGFLSYAIR